MIVDDQRGSSRGGTGQRSGGRFVAVLDIGRPLVGHHSPSGAAGLRRISGTWHPAVPVTRGVGNSLLERITAHTFISVLQSCELVSLIFADV